MGDKTQNKTCQSIPCKPIDESTYQCPEHDQKSLTSSSKDSANHDAEQSSPKSRVPAVEQSEEEESSNMRWLNTRRRTHRHIRQKRQNFRRKKY